MNFTYEFEIMASNNKTYVAEVEGTVVRDECGPCVELEHMSFLDEEGNLVEKTEDVYSELVEEAEAYDYELENHYTDNSFYGEHDEF